MEQEETRMEIDMDAPLTELLKGRKHNKAKKKEKAKKTTVDVEGNDNGDELSSGAAVSVFDYSVENHFRAMDYISTLCGEPDSPNLDRAQIERLSSSITFLREWRHFNYPSRTIRFACENESKMGKDVVGEIDLPQFSSAIVPKIQKHLENGVTTSSKSSKDFIIYVGGPIWGLDWCPRVKLSDSDIKSEFIAVSAHPPESSYHKLGAPLTGRGVIQIWCLLSINMEEGKPSEVKKKQKPTKQQKPQGRPRKHPLNESASTIKKPRGRPRKHPLNESANKIDCNVQNVHPLAVQNPEDLSSLLAVETISASPHGQVSQIDFGLEQKISDEEVSLDKSLSSENAVHIHSCGTRLTRCSIPKDVSLPRLVFCLAHNGKVAWDLKWYPSNVYDGHRMGYLAVLLGNGALEVWEVPSPCTVNAIYNSCQKEGTDPRFIKLKPVFKCSKIKCGDRQSIPLTLEWSASLPHDMILTGCHDGVVALWKFSPAHSSEDTRPLLCFSADTVPIRALSWAPVESYSESANIIVTAGHKGLKFWDIRDPFHPLWDFPVQRVIYGLDWLSDPRCIIVSLDDGTVRIMSLVNAANNVPVTGAPFVGTSQQGFHSYFCSAFPIWCIQASRLTGMIAYCGSDGTALHFQLTTKAVEKDPFRNRAPHFLCGALSQEGSAVTVFTPLPGVPFPMKKSLNEWGDTPRSIRGFLTKSNQEKRAKSKQAKVQTSDDLLTVRYDNESGMELGSDGTIPGNSSNQGTKHKTNSKKKSKANELALICVDDNPEIAQEKGEEEGKTGDEFEVLPPKSVAMHRVRWNMNKGSENLLCYGGAAGILRCQEIDLFGV